VRLPVAEEQSRTRGSQSSGVEDQPPCRGMWHISRHSARSFSRSPSPPPPSFTQSPSPPRSLVRDGQTSPHRPRFVVSRSTCPPLSPSPLANSFIIGTAVINTHTLRLSQGASLKPDESEGRSPVSGGGTIRLCFVATQGLCITILTASGSLSVSSSFQPLTRDPVQFSLPRSLCKLALACMPFPLAMSELF
jgi:hypothetical protein